MKTAKLYRVGLLAIGSVCLWIAVIALSRFPFDDSYIHMRIARNLAFQGVPFFNPAERVMGGSSPLWLLIVAGLFRVIGHPAPAAVIALECGIATALIITFDAWLRDVLERASAWITLVAIGIVAGLVLPAIGFLMETGLAVLLGVSGALALAKNRPVVAGLLLGLALMTRYEMAIFAGIVFLLTPTFRAKQRFLFGFLPLALAEVLLLWLWYGTIVPNTVRAKSIAYPISFRQFLDTVPGWPSAHGVTAFIWIVGSLVCAALVWSKLWEASNKSLAAKRSVAMLGAFAGALFVAYAVRRTSMFQWYWANIAAPAALAAAATAFRLWEARGAGLLTPKLIATGSSAVAVIGLASFPTAARSGNTVLSACRDRPASSATLEASLRIQTYFAVGQSLYARCPRGTLLTSEIGAVGWSFPGRLVDGLGLVSPEVLKHHPMKVPEQRASETVGAIPAEAVAELQPDFVMGMDLFLEDFVKQRLKNPRLAGYEVVDDRPVIFEGGTARTLWNSKSVLTFARADSCKPSAAR